MFVQKVPHIKDQFLTQERASMELESGQIDRKSTRLNSSHAT